MQKVGTFGIQSCKQAVTAQKKKKKKKRLIYKEKKMLHMTGSIKIFFVMDSFAFTSVPSLRSE